MIVCSTNMAQKDAFSVPGGRQRLAQQGCGRLEQPDRGCMKTHNLFVRVESSSLCLNVCPEPVLAK
jgi:hypothetical protein